MAIGEPRWEFERKAAPVLAALILSAPSGAGAAEATWVAEPPASRITVKVLKQGLLAGLAHDHDFLATTWRATLRLDPGEGGPSRVEVVVQAGSLHDREPALSAEDRAAVDRQAVKSLEAERFPEIRFTAEQPIRVAPDGTTDLDLAGTLSLHGHERPLTLHLQVRRDGAAWRAAGRAVFTQRAFGIEPFSGFLGTISVRDEVELEVELELVPTPGA